MLCNLKDTCENWHRLLVYTLPHTKLLLQPTGLTREGSSNGKNKTSKHSHSIWHLSQADFSKQDKVHLHKLERT